MELTITTSKEKASDRHPVPYARKPDKQRVTRALNVRLLLWSLGIAVIASTLGCAWYLYRANQLAGALLQRAETLKQDEQWDQAEQYFRRYLQLRPQDLDARIQLLDVIERTASSPGQRRRLIALLSETIGLISHRSDLRVKLAQNLLDVGRFADAQAEAERLLAQSESASASLSAAQVVALQRIKALATYARAGRSGLVSVADAARNLRLAWDSNPADEQVAAALAEVYRTAPRETAVADAAAEADRIMDRLIEANPDNTKARLARYFYNRKYRMANARLDLDALLQRDPNHVEALLLLASEDFSSGTTEGRAAAENRLQQVISLAPEDPRGHIALARMHVIAGDKERAADVLRQARGKVTTPSIELDVQYADLLIELNRGSDVERVLTEIERNFRERLPELPSATRARLDNSIRMLKSRQLIARNDLEHAERELRSITASAEQSGSDLTGISDRRQAYAMLASVMTKQKRLDLAADYWKAVADQARVAPEPLWNADLARDLRDARWKAANALLELGRSAEAIQQVEMYLQSPAASPLAWITLVDGHYQQQLRLAPARRNWIEFLAALQEAKAKLPNRWELALAEALHQAALDTEASKEQATKQLQALEESAPADSGVWQRLAVIYQQLGATPDADRALTRYDQLEADTVRRLLLRVALLVRSDRAEDALQQLSAAVSSATPDESRELQKQRVALLVSLNRLSEAGQLIQELIQAAPKDTELLTMAWEIAESQEDYAKAQQWEEALANGTTIADEDLRLFRARRMIGEFAKLELPARAEAKQMIELLQASRPSWYPIVALAGQLAELEGRRADAIEAYQSALELGDTRPVTLERLVATLFAEGRYGDVDEYMTRLVNDQRAYGRLETIAIASAVKGNRLQEALQMAKQAVDRGSNDPMHHVWFGSLLLLDGQQAAAEQTFQESVQRFPKDARVWSGLFRYLVRTYQFGEARKTLHEWSEKVAVDELMRHSVLAQGYEMLGDFAAAKQEYLAAIAQDGRNVNARVRLARLLIQSDPSVARLQYEEILKVDPQHGEARRALAMVLAASGGKEDWARAIQLLEGPRSEANDLLGFDDRLRAVLLARRGKSREEKLRNYTVAKRIVASRLEGNRGQVLDLDHMLLAGLLEREALLRRDPALLQATRDALRPLVDRPNPPANYLIPYIEFLLRHLEQNTILKAGVIQTNDQREVFVSDARLRMNELETALTKSPIGEPRFTLAALRVRLLSIEKNASEARKLIENYATAQEPSATTDASRARLYLQLGQLYSTIGDHSQAESWFRRLVALAPEGYVLLAQSLIQQNRMDEAVETCLRSWTKSSSADAAAVLAHLMSTNSISEEMRQRVLPVIASALKEHNNNVNLLASVAVERITEGNQAEAIQLFEKILDINPNHALALNNLATLLAERPNQLKEARDFVERAMSQWGRDPALLDTLGTILIRAGEFRQAVTELEEAVAEGAPDPRYNFHLAVAYHRAGNVSDAVEALDAARKQGLDRAILTSGDRELLESLEHDLTTSSTLAD